MKATLWVAPVATLVIFFGSMGVASLTGSWVTGGREQVVATERLAVDDIKGWMTIQQAADGLGVPAGAIIGVIDPSGQAGLTAATALKDIEAIVPGFTLSGLREQLRAFLAAGPVPASPTR
jgi:hypothetical protein